MEGTITSHWEAVYYLLKTYTTYNVVAGTGADMMLFTQPSNKSPMEYAVALRNETLKGDRVYDEYFLKGIFIEVSSASIPHNMGSNLNLKRNDRVLGLLHPVTSCTNPQHGLHSTLLLQEESESSITLVLEASHPIFTDKSDSLNKKDTKAKTNVLLPRSRTVRF